MSINRLFKKHREHYADKLKSVIRSQNAEIIALEELFAEERDKRKAAEKTLTEWREECEKCCQKNIE